MLSISLSVLSEDLKLVVLRTDTLYVHQVEILFHPQDKPGETRKVSLCREQLS